MHYEQKLGQRECTSVGNSLVLASEFVPRVKHDSSITSRQIDATDVSTNKHTNQRVKITRVDPSRPGWDMLTCVALFGSICLS